MRVATGLLRSLHRQHTMASTSGSQQALSLICSLPHRVISVRYTSTPPPEILPKEGGLMWKYEEWLKQWPRVYDYNRRIINGGRWCAADVKTLWRVWNDRRSGRRRLSDLSLSELEVAMQSPNELVGITVLLFLLQFPVVGETIIVLAVFMPRLVLTRHFWSPTQRRHFWADMTRKRLEAASHIDVDAIRKVGKLENLDSQGLWWLCSLHGFLALGDGVGRLRHRAELLREQDLRLQSQFAQLDKEQLLFHLTARRLDHSSLDESEMRDKLQEWIQKTANADELTYLLAPVLIAQNYNL